MTQQIFKTQHLQTVGGKMEEQFRLTSLKKKQQQFKVVYFKIATRIKEGLFIMISQDRQCKITCSKTI